MLIKCVLENACNFVDGENLYKVVNGITEVPEELGITMCNMPHWKPVYEHVGEDVLNVIRGIEPQKLESIEKPTIKQVEEVVPSVKNKKGK